MSTTTPNAAELSELQHNLTRHGFVRCDIAACNCGGWRHRYGLRQRFDEFKQALSDAGHPLTNDNGNLALNALGELVAERDALRAALAQQVPEPLLTALRFYAHGEHYNVDSDEFDTVSGEPQNWLCHSEDPTMIEDGTIAKAALRGIAVSWVDGGEDSTPQPIDGEKFTTAQQVPAVPGWISVTERLPEKNTEVMIAFVGQNTLCATGQYTGNSKDVQGWCYPWENRGATDNGDDPVVTHWMPLPSAPLPTQEKP